MRTVGDETFRVCRELVDEMVTVNTDEICAAIKHGFNDTRSIMEPAGALAVAGLVKHTALNKLEGKFSAKAGREKYRSARRSTDSNVLEDAGWILFCLATTRTPHHDSTSVLAVPRQLYPEYINMLTCCRADIVRGDDDVASFPGSFFRPELRCYIVRSVQYSTRASSTTMHAGPTSPCQLPRTAASKLRDCRTQLPSFV